MGSKGPWVGRTQAAAKNPVFVHGVLALPDELRGHPTNVIFVSTAELNVAALVI